MRLKRLMCAVVAGAFLVALAGCGATTNSNSMRGNSRTSQYRKPSISDASGGASLARAGSKASVSEVNYYGRQAYKLTNGLVSVVAVPDLGGRIMEYSLGQRDLFWVNAAELARSEAASEGDSEVWRNFGGYKVWPAPQDKWGGPPDPDGSPLDGGKWTGQIISRSGQSAVIEMMSPQDPIVTGLQITRRVTLTPGTTQVQVEETFANVRSKAITWSVWTVTQVPGSLEPGEKVSSQAQVFFPVKSGTKHKGGFFYLTDGTSSQWEPIANGSILRTTYKGETAKIGSDSDAGWVSYVDGVHAVTLVQKFSAPSGEYPDNGSRVQVYTSPDTLSYMEIETLSPLKTLKPGEKFTRRTDFYCAAVGGPTIKVTDAGAVKSHPTATRQGSNVVISGEIGVFTPGEIKVEFMDAKGKRLAESRGTRVSPGTAIRLRITAPMPAGAENAMVVLKNDRGRAVGNIAQVPLATAVAKAADKPSSG